jgi:glycine/D-amino acid oxidase-like deaminating enzyme
MNEISFSYWEQQTFLNHYDVIIIGSGMVGLNAALHLKTKQANLKIAVLEKGFLPSGASTKNAGFACFGSVTELLSEIIVYGEEKVFNLVAKRLKGLETLRNILGDKAISYQQKGSFELFLNTDESKTEQAFSSINYLNKVLKPLTNQPDIFAEANDKIADFGFAGVDGLINNSLEGQIDTGKMMQALLIKTQALGVSIFNNCKLLSYQKENNHISISTDKGYFKTKKILFATNGFTSSLLPEIDIKPARGQVLVTELIQNLKISGTYHYDEGFYYFRDIDNRILLGGGRNLDFNAEETDELTVTKPVQEKLEQLLNEVILPKQKVKIDYRWSGIMGFGEELEPIVKKIEDDVYVAAKCNGMGVAIGSLTGQEIADLIFEDL